MMATQEISLEQGDLLDLEAAAERLCVSKTTLYRMLDRGEIKGIKVGRQWRFRAADLDAYLARGPVAMALTALPAAVVEAEVAALGALLAPYGAPLPVVDDPALDGWEAAVQQLLLAIVRLAVLQRATDIHLEPAREGTAVVGLLRFRIDGFLHVIHRLPQRVHEAVLLRTRLLARGEAGDGGYLDASLHLAVDGETIDLRLSLLASYLGPALSARLLAVAGTGLLALDELGLHPDDLARVKTWMEPQAGLIFVNGPAGSGKTTLLYRLLELAVTDAQKVVSVEDPVERYMPGVMQIEINAQTRNFASVMRALPRLDADTVLVTELRDLETIQAVLTLARIGHHVLTAVHLPRASAVLHRVMEVFPADREMELRQAIAQGVQGMIGVRLARLLCPQCKVAHALPPEAREEVATLAATCGAVLPEAPAFFRPVGCVHCANTGYRGRTGLYELVEMTPALREALLQGVSREEFAARTAGTRTLATEALRKAVEGLIALDEVLPLVRRYARDEM
jgi:excisionase family DNA binding protein